MCWWDPTTEYKLQPGPYHLQQIYYKTLVPRLRAKSHLGTGWCISPICTTTHLIICQHQDPVVVSAEVVARCRKILSARIHERRTTDRLVFVGCGVIPGGG